jgi:P-type conjugative transfer protein TrbJ
MRNLSSITNMTIPSASKARRRSRKPWMIAFVAAGALALLPSQRASAFLFDPIIFDPQALVEHAAQVASLIQQVEAATEQVQNQLKELAHLGSSFAPDVLNVVAGIAGQFESRLYTTADPAAQLDSRFPPDMSTATWDQFQSDQTTWTQDERQSLAENRQLQDQIYQDMYTTQQQVQDIGAASDSAPGETAAMQAHNDLLAVESSELSKLQALRTARARLKAERLAREQSELSFAAAERERVRDGWADPAPPNSSLVDAFGN